MRELMIRAHQLTKEIKKEFPEVDYKFQLGICMSYLLAEKKNKRENNEMVELIGTPKQVKWAESIRKDMKNKAEKKLKTFEKLQEKNPKAIPSCNSLRAFLKRLEIESSAKWFIEHETDGVTFYGREWE